MGILPHLLYIPRSYPLPYLERKECEDIFQHRREHVITILLKIVIDLDTMRALGGMSRGMPLPNN